MPLIDVISSCPGCDQNLECRNRYGTQERVGNRVDHKLCPGTPRGRAQFGLHCVQGVQQLAESQIDDRHQQSVAITEVVLDHSPRDTRTFSDVFGARGAETLFEDASHRFVDDGRAGAVGTELLSVDRSARRDVGAHYRMPILFTLRRPETRSAAASDARPHRHRSASTAATARRGRSTVPRRCRPPSAR